MAQATLPGSLARAATTPAPASHGPWLVSRGWDVAVFGGSALLAFALLAAGAARDALAAPLPVWTWVATVVCVDVAHVWATAYRVYLDPEELRRRPALYAAVPLGAYVLGVLLYSGSSSLFWRVLAYVAVFHFVRQQYGWVALYRRRTPPPTAFDGRLDDAAIYSATLYPLLYWHAHLPREFEWFIAGDFLPGLPVSAASLVQPVHFAISGVWALRQLQLRAQGRPVNPGKVLVIVSTWLAWYAGIVVFDSDYAFTVTNVLVHGIPYLAFVWIHGRARWRGITGGIAGVFRPRLWPVYLAPLVAAAWLEEWAWDRALWHEHGALFPGPELALGADSLALLVPLLALPQATHYMLDAWIWRVRPENPDLGRHLDAAPGAQA
ncbi:MAG: hypothetical protein AB7O37_19340 [Vicinamibacteria bacterium]